jgi:hypothetical protein
MCVSAMHLLTMQIRIFSALFTGGGSMNAPAPAPVRGPGPGDACDEAPEGPQMPPTLLEAEPARS